MVFMDTFSTHLLLYITAIKGYLYSQFYCICSLEIWEVLEIQFDRISKIIIVVYKYLFSAKVNTRILTAIPQSSRN
jgi:hypothetical protein